jgi:predicted peroxiredoxin
MRDWIPRHFDFCGYVLGEHPDQFGPRQELRARLGYREDEKICIVTVGGSGVGGCLIRRILAAYPIAKRRIPELRMVVVTGPRLDPAGFDLPDGVEARGFVPDLDRHLAACDLAVVQGGLTTTMELAAAGTPFLYFPLKNHFEQNFHVAHRLDQYGAGRRMDYQSSDPDRIAAAMVEELARPVAYRPVEADGAVRDDLEKATVAMIVAGAASAMDGETAVFMTGESVRMATKGGVDGLAVEKYPSLTELFEAYAENGGRLWVCPACAGARGIGAEDLIGNAEIAGAARTIGYINDGAKVIM